MAKKRAAQSPARDTSEIDISGVVLPEDIDLIPPSEGGVTDATALSRDVAATQDEPQIDASGIDLSGVDTSGIEVPEELAARAPQTSKGFWSAVLDAYGSDWADVPELTKRMVEAAAASRTLPANATGNERLKAWAEARQAQSAQNRAQAKAFFSNMLRALNAPGAALNLMIDDTADRGAIEGRRLNVTKEDYAKSLAGEGSAADRMAQMNALGQDETLNRSVGTVRDLVLSPGLLITALARAPKLAKALPWLKMADEALPKVSSHVENLGKTIYGAGMRGVKTGMSEMRDAAKVSSDAYIERMMDEGVGKGAWSADALWKQADEVRQGIGSKLGAIRKKLFGESGIDLAPGLRDVLTREGFSFSGFRKLLSGNHPVFTEKGIDEITQIRKALDMLEEAQPKLKPLLSKLKEGVEGVGKKETQQFAQEIGEELSRGPISLERFEEMRQRLQASAFGNIPMGQNANAKNFRGNPRVTRAKNVRRDMTDLMDELVDERALASGMTQEALDAERAALDKLAFDYSLFTRGNKGLARDVKASTGRLPFTQADALTVAHALREGGDNWAYFLLKKATGLLNNPIHGTKIGLGLRSAARSPWVSTLMDGGARDAALYGARLLTAPEQ